MRRDVVVRPAPLDGIALRFIEHRSVLANRLRLGTESFPVAGLLAVIGRIAVGLRLQGSRR